MAKITKDSDVFSRTIVTFLAFFMVVLILYSTVQVVFEHSLTRRIRKQDRQVEIQLAKQKLGILIKEKITQIELQAKKLLLSDNTQFILLCHKKTQELTVLLEELLSVLEKGGSFTKSIPVNLNTIDEIQETIEYNKVEESLHQEHPDSGSIVIEVIDILPKIEEIRSILDSMVTIKIQLTSEPYADVTGLSGEQLREVDNYRKDLQFSMLQADTLFLRCHENSNKILVDSTKDLDVHRKARQELSRFADLVRTYFYIVLQVIITAMFVFIFIKITRILKAANATVLERERLLQREREANLSLEEIVNNVPVGIVIISSAKKIIQVNAEAERILGYGPGEAMTLLAGNICHDNFCTLHENECPVFDLHEARVVLKERVAVKKDKSTLTILKSVIPITLDGEPVLLEAFMDISAIKQAESAILEAKRSAESANRAKSEFLANMSHEIRTPMNAIIGFTELLEESEENPERRNQLNLISQSANALLDLINKILDVSKIEAGKIQIEKQPFSLEVLCQQLTSTFFLSAREKDLSIDLVIESELPPLLLGDELRLRGVLTNLVGNAVKFTSRGKIVITVKYTQPDCTIEICDTGVGIPAERIKDIFNKFVQADSSTERKFGGSGLGLAISRSLVEMMGGTIKVESVEGKGATFTLTLPLPPADQPSQFSVQPEDKGTGSCLVPAKSIQCLVVDDNEINNELTGEFLGILEIGCDYAENGQIALEMMERQQYDFVLLDMNMPVMNGRETLKRMQEDEQLAQLPVIALTADAILGQDREYLEAGCRAYISKPFTMKILRTTIVKALPNLFTDGSADVAERAQFDSTDGNAMSSRYRSGDIALLQGAISVLEANRELFDPDELEQLAEKLLENSKAKIIQHIAQEIRSAAQTYDDMAMPEILEQCENLVKEQESLTP